MKREAKFSPGGLSRLRDVDMRLHAKYGAPERELGNQCDPLDEAVYIILSYQTDLARCKETWERLRSKYREWSLVDQAPLEEIAETIRLGGLQRQKAKRIRDLLRAVYRDFGGFSLDGLRTMSVIDAERTLTRMPGLSLKGARCVLLYSLEAQTFPIDSNTFRILIRTGILPKSTVYRRRAVHDLVQESVPRDRRRLFHVNLVLHGQRSCLPREPKCDRCPVVPRCPRIGLAGSGRQGDRLTSKARIVRRPKTPMARSQRQIVPAAN